MSAESLETGLARVEEKLDGLRFRIEAGARESEQAGELIKAQVASFALALDEIRAQAIRDREHADAATTAVRTDITAQVGTALSQITDLRLTKAWFTGVIATCTALGGLASGIAVKVVGG